MQFENILKKEFSVTFSMKYTDKQKDKINEINNIISQIPNI